MANMQDIIDSWNVAAVKEPEAIHPFRNVSELAYWESGRLQAQSMGHLVNKDDVILDMGCGDGRVAHAFHERGVSIIGADSSEKMLERLQKKCPGMETIISNGADLPEVLENTGLPKVDMLYCLAVLIHHDWKSGVAMIQGMAEAVKPGGYLVLDWPTATDTLARERTWWCDVTTWDAKAQAAIAEHCGLVRCDDELMWAVYRKVGK